MGATTQWCYSQSRAGEKLISSDLVMANNEKLTKAQSLMNTLLVNDWTSFETHWFQLIYGKSRNMLFWLLLLHVIDMPGPLFSLNQDLI